MSHKDLQEAVRRFNFWIGVGFTLTPVLGFGTAVLFGLIDVRDIQHALASGILPGFLILLLTWTLVHFRKFLGPLLAWVTRHPEGVATPPRLSRRFSAERMISSATSAMLRSSSRSEVTR